VGQNSSDIRRETFINHGFKVTCLSFKGLWIWGPGLRSKVRRYLEVSFKWEVVLSRSEIYSRGGSGQVLVSCPDGLGYVVRPVATMSTTTLNPKP
jgi:hypothetical protein